MAKVKTFKTIFPAVSVPLKDDYSIDEPAFRAYLRWLKTRPGLSRSTPPRSAPRSAAT